MITMDTFLILLFIVSVITSLVVEGLKGLFPKNHPPSNVLASVTSIVLGAIVGIFYCIMANIAFNMKIVIILIVLMFLSWLCAMHGYDKILQTISQIKGRSK